jgi:hypothetical protein
MELDILVGILEEVIPGGGFTSAGQPRLNGDTWVIPFRHYQFGLGQIFLADRDVVGTSDHQALAKEIGKQLVWAVDSSQ